MGLPFSPLCAWLGRRRAFVFGHTAFLIVPITCYLPQTYDQLLFILPVFGFFTLCMHAGYAVYFRNYFPTIYGRRGPVSVSMGASAALMLILSEWYKAMGINTQLALSLLATTSLGLGSWHSCRKRRGRICRSDYSSVKPVAGVAMRISWEPLARVSS